MCTEKTVSKEIELETVHLADFAEVKAGECSREAWCSIRL